MSRNRFTVQLATSILQQIDDIRFSRRDITRSVTLQHLLRLGLDNKDKAMLIRPDATPSETPDKKQNCTFSLDDKMFRELNDFQFRNRYMSRSSATLALLHVGLACHQSQDRGD